ncbi:MAG TPA: type II secretion system protein [Chloroflexi bacterium]|jgi:prepilin-type N-terminal cleavage/methylation domain-containing protein|nr:type II secretion system protein [Chloroflexota bacterium]
MRKEHGFTLIELLIVLAILGILVGVVAMSVGGLTDSAKSRAVTAEYQVVQTAIDTYNTQDVAVDLSNPIPERATAAPVEAGDGSTEPYFNKYLKRDTKYSYGWKADGVELCTDDHPDSAYHCTATP